MHAAGPAGLAAGNGFHVCHFPWSWSQFCRTNGVGFGRLVFSVQQNVQWNRCDVCVGRCMNHWNGRRSTRDKTIYDATFRICFGIRFCAPGIGHESSHHNKTEATQKRKSENIACVTLINGKSNWKIRFANVCGGKIFIAIRWLLLLLCARWIEYNSNGNRQATIRLVHRELQNCMERSEAKWSSAWLIVIWKNKKPKKKWQNQIEKREKMK